MAPAGPVHRGPAVNVVSSRPRFPESQGAETLRGEIRRYEDLREGRVRQRKLDGLTVLIEARIATRLTQRGLAERLGLKEQQIQRWESDRYSSVSLRRIPEVIDALGMGIAETVRYAAAA